MDKSRLIDVAGVAMHVDSAVSEALNTIVAGEIQRTYDGTATDAKQLDILSEALRKVARSLYEVVYRVDCEFDRCTGLVEADTGVPASEQA